MLPPNAHLKDHENYTELLMKQAQPFQNSVQQSSSIFAGGVCMAAAAPPQQQQVPPNSVSYGDSFKVDVRFPQCYYMSKPKGLPEN